MSGVWPEWVDGDHVTIEANDQYKWGPKDLFRNTGRPYLDRITHRIYKDLTTKATALESGELDMAARLQTEDVVRLQDAKDLVAAPLLHDTPEELAQPLGDVRDWKAGQCATSGGERGGRGFARSPDVSRAFQTKPWRFLFPRPRKSSANTIDLGLIHQMHWIR